MNKCIVHLKGDVSASEQIAALTCMQTISGKKTTTKKHKTKLVALLVILSLH